MLIDKNFPSPNFSPRKDNIDFIIIHFTDMKFNDALERLTDPIAEVSAHYLIKNNGELLQLVDDNMIAWHAGKSYWNGIESLNKYSIGIELDNLGVSDFSTKQFNKCIELCKYLKKKYSIKKENIIGHSDIAPNRKIDPGIFFDWSIFAQHNLTIWHDINLEKINYENLYFLNEENENIKILQKKLSNIGYKININGIFDLDTNYVIRAFQAKFFPQKIKKLGIEYYRNMNSIYQWDNISDNILSNLIAKL